jgi:hypothetical protein
MATKGRHLKPLCFVLAPLGTTSPADSRPAMDFEVVYDGVVRPAIEATGMEPFRAGADSSGEISRSQVFEWLLLCEYAVVDLTTADADVCYQLGIRHAARPDTTVFIVADGAQLPLEMAPEDVCTYRLTGEGRLLHADQSVAEISARLTAARAPVTRSPIHELVGDWPGLSHSKTDVFHERVEEPSTIKDTLARARSLPSAAESIDALRAVEAGLDVDGTDAAVLVDLLLSYRAAAAWDEVIRLVDSMPPPLRSQTLVREQLGLALNRAGRGDQAERVLLDLLAQRGPTPETNSILGRVYKDRYRQALASGRTADAQAYLTQAIDTYLQGFEADWRDAFPGINAIQLIHEADAADPRLAELTPVVHYAVRRKIASGRGDYWDHATLLELAVLAGDRDAARSAAADAGAAPTEGWMLDTTVDTLRVIAERTGASWVADLEADLRNGPTGSS